MHEYCNLNFSDLFFAVPYKAEEKCKTLSVVSQFSSWMVIAYNLRHSDFGTMLCKKIRYDPVDKFHTERFYTYFASFRVCCRPSTLTTDVSSSLKSPIGAWLCVMELFGSFL